MNSWPSPRQLTGSIGLPLWIGSSCCRRSPRESSSVRMPGLRQKLIAAYSRPGESGRKLPTQAVWAWPTRYWRRMTPRWSSWMNAFVAAAPVDHWRGVFFARDVADEHRVGVLLQRLVVRPNLLAGAVPQRVADGEQVAAADGVGIGERVVAGAALAGPERFQVAVEDPEVPVAVLHEDFAAARVAREIEEDDRVAVGPLVVRAARGGLRHVRVAGDFRQVGRRASPCPCGRRALAGESPCRARRRRGRCRRDRGFGTACRR